MGRKPSDGESALARIEAKLDRLLDLHSHAAEMVPEVVISQRDLHEATPAQLSDWAVMFQVKTKGKSPNVLREELERFILKHGELIEEQVTDELKVPKKGKNKQPVARPTSDIKKGLKVKTQDRNKTVLGVVNTVTRKGRIVVHWEDDTEERMTADEFNRYCEVA